MGIESQDLTVGDFDDAELAEISSAIPGLRRPLSQNPLRQLLRRPFFLDKAARMNWPETELLPANEREFRKKVWNEVVKKNDEGQFEGIPARRGQVMVSIAFRRARAMEPYVLGASEDPGILHRLAQDSLLSKPSADQNLFAPAHDAFEDWALMQWLDDEFAANGGRIDALFSEVGTYPALRRSYRKWLTELLDSSPQTADRLILEVIRNAALPAHWRDDTLVATLLSKDADTFLSRNSTALLRDHGALMWQTIHLLRVACQYAIPRTGWGLSGEGFMFLPRGSAWFSTAEILEAAIPQLTNERFPLILEFLEKWRLFTRLGVAYPRAVRSVINLAFHFLPYADAYECPVQDADKRLLALILTFPGAARQQVTNLVTRALGQGHRDREGVLALIFNHFYGEAIFRDMADLGYRVAEHALYLNIPLDQLIGGRSGFGISEMEDAFALGGRAHEDHPSSAFHGPYARMLQFDPQRGIDFIIRFINRCCDAFAHLDNEVEFVEPPFTVRFKLPDGSYSEQYANDRLWAAYRAASVVPDTFASALMALERWLLDEAHRGATTIDELLTSILTRSNNVALTAVVASVVTAYPNIAPETVLSLLSCPYFLRVDLARPIQESSLQSMGFSGLTRDFEDAQYNRERAESLKSPHRQQTLENLCVTLQTGALRERVWTVIDELIAALPPVDEQDGETRVWRIQLHRMDLRHLVATGQTDDGRIILQTAPPPAELQAIIDEQRPRTEFHQTVMWLFHWGESIFSGKQTENADTSDWRERLDQIRAQVASHDSDDDQMPLRLMYGAAAYIAAVCIRDHWADLSPKEKEWVCQTVFGAIEADADTGEFLSIGALNPFEGSRPAAHIVFALWGKDLPARNQARVLPAMAKAITSAVEETVNYAFGGLSRYLWGQDRALAMTCIQAVVTLAQETHQFWEQQRALPFVQRQSTNPDVTAIRVRARKSIEQRRAADEGQIAGLDLTVFPGRSVAAHLLAITAKHFDDPLAQELFRRQTSTLPNLWRLKRQNGRRSGRGADQQSFDPEIEHVLVKAICEFVLQLPPSEALTLFGPIVAMTTEFPAKAADLVKWLILSKATSPKRAPYGGSGSRSPTHSEPALWCLGRR